METTTKTAAAMTAASVSRAAVLMGAGAPHAGDLGAVQGWSVSASVRDRGAAIAFAPITGCVDPCLEGPPV